ncbi:hypothetical protein B0H14DRAFT_3522620 [Mycena olivaceomarginata]|nr:hypothetical protein B0H14DRAFT_3522620 [Mycena olivaceomarginata]
MSAGYSKLKYVKCLERYRASMSEDSVKNRKFGTRESFGDLSYSTSVSLCIVAEDSQGVKSNVPSIDHFYDNSLQTELMRDVAVDLELLGERLHHDTTADQLMFKTSLKNGVIKYTDSSLLQSIALDG